MNVPVSPRDLPIPEDSPAKGHEAALGSHEWRQLDAYWRAANYLSVGQIYLYANPLLREPLTLAHVKPLVVGHWGTTPGQNFIYVHLNRTIRLHDLDMIYIAGPGHGGPALVANTYLEGSYSEIYPDISQDEAGMKRLFKQFSFPGGISSHVAPTTPGSIHEGGELGYSLSHAFGAAFDNPGLIVACIVGDGEAETGPLATAWQSNKFLDPITDGAVLPILHLNGFKISNPTVLARVEHEELENFFRGCGWTPLFVEGEEPEEMSDPGNPEERARKQRSRAAALAHDRPQIAQRLDRAEGRRRLEDRRHFSGASGSPARRRRASRPCQALGKLDEELQGGRTLRCERNAKNRTRRARAEGRASHGRQPKRQRWDSSSRFTNARLSRSCGFRPCARRRECARHPGARQIPARRDAP
jgi:XFP N-terminal domain